MRRLGLEGYKACRKDWSGIVQSTAIKTIQTAFPKDILAMDAQSGIEFQRDMFQCELARIAGRAGCVGYHYLLHTLSQPCLYALGLAVMCHATMNYADIPDLVASWRHACALPLQVLESHPRYWLSLSSEGWTQLTSSLATLAQEVLRRSGNLALGRKVNGRLTVEESVNVVKVLSEAMLFRTVLLMERQGTYEAIDLTPDGKFWVLLGVDQWGNYYYFSDRYFLRGWEMAGFPYYCLPQEEIPIRLSSRQIAPREFNPSSNPPPESAFEVALKFISALSSCSLPPTADQSRKQLINQLRALPPSDLVTTTFQLLERMTTKASPFPQDRRCQMCQNMFKLEYLHWHNGSSSPHTLCSNCIRTSQKCPVCEVAFDAEILEWANRPSELDSQV